MTPHNKQGETLWQVYEVLARRYLALSRNHNCQAHQPDHSDAFTAASLISSHRTKFGKGTLPLTAIDSVHSYWLPMEEKKIDVNGYIHTHILHLYTDCIFSWY